MADDPPLQLVNERGWLCGFPNLLRLENERWWLTRRWWVHTLALMVALNGLLVYGLWVDQETVFDGFPPEAVAGTLDVLLMWMSILTVMDVLFVVQGAIVGEKQNGVAAWLMSGPASRPAYILAKFIGNAVGVVSTAIIFQAVVAYGQLSLKASRLLPVLPLTAALGLQVVYVLFYLALAVMLGVFFSSRVPVLAISFAVLLGQPFLDRLASESAPGLLWALPTKLPELARFAQRGEALPSILPLIVVPALILSFLAIAIWRFQREEF